MSAVPALVSTVAEVEHATYAYANLTTGTLAAPNSARNVVLLQTRARAVVASIGAHVARVDTRLILLGAHGVGPLEAKSAESTLHMSVHASLNSRRGLRGKSFARSP